VRLAAAPSLGLYATAGRMSREPARSDMLNGEDDASLPYDLEAVEPESLADFELGADWRRGRLALHAGVYAMEFENEIALSGELTEVGLPARRNAGRSHRRGLELDASFAASPRLRLSANAVLSRNAIDAWTQAYDVYDEAGAWLESLTLVHRDVAPLLTPEAIVNAAVEWKPAAQLSLFAQGRYVSEAQLDNTGRAGFRTPSFFNLDLQASLSLRGLLAKGEPQLRVQAVNLLDDERIWPSGYSYVYFVRGPGGDALAGSSYYYPQATRSLYATLELRF
jgi:iron complex outermembrane receptor protein